MKQNRAGMLREDRRGAGLFTRHGAPAAVGIDDDHPEDALAEAGDNFHRRFQGKDVREEIMQNQPKWRIAFFILKMQFSPAILQGSAIYNFNSIPPTVSV